MTYRTRIKYTAKQKSEIWDRWQRGESLNSIGRVFDRPSSSIFNHLAPSGGIRPLPRRRSRLALTLAEREEISRGVASQLSLRSIAAQLGRSPSTISREIKRNGGDGNYRAAPADQAAFDRGCRPKLCKLACNRQLSRAVATKLQLNWSPEQIAGWLKREHPGEESNQVSHETIYRSLFVQARGVLEKELQQHLRSERAIRRSIHSGQHEDGRGQIPHAISIRERPASVEDRAVPGHWEGDLIAGSNNSYIATLVERHTRYVTLIKIDDRKSATVVPALIKQAKKLPAELYKFLMQVSKGVHKGVNLFNEVINFFNTYVPKPGLTRLKIPNLTLDIPIKTDSMTSKNWMRKLADKNHPATLAENVGVS